MNIFGMNITTKELFLTAISGVGVVIVIGIYNKFFKNKGDDSYRVDQGKSKVGGDQVGRDKTEYK